MIEFSFSPWKSQWIFYWNFLWKNRVFSWIFSFSRIFPFNFSRFNPRKWKIPFEEFYSLKEFNRNEEIYRRIYSTQSNSVGICENFSYEMAGRLLEWAKLARETLRLIRVPFMVQHGGRDSLCSPLGSRELLFEASDRLPRSFIRLIAHGRCWHNLFLEPEADLVIEYAVEFIEQRMQHFKLVESLD